MAYKKWLATTRNSVGTTQLRNLNLSNTTFKERVAFKLMGLQEDIIEPVRSTSHQSLQFLLGKGGTGEDSEKKLNFVIKKFLKQKVTRRGGGGLENYKLL